MPVQLNWYPVPPVLLATYSGVLTHADYQAMCSQRRRMLDAGSGTVVLLVDLRRLEGVSFPEPAELGDNVLTDLKVYRTLIVLEDRLYHRLAPAIAHGAGPGLVVLFFYDLDAAFTQAEALLTPPA